MSSDTDSPVSSEYAAMERKNKSNRKHKRKSDKKHKKEKKEKRHHYKLKKRKNEAVSCSVDDESPVKVTKLHPLAPSEVATTAEDVDAFGPALPPHLLQQSKATKKEKPVIGPIMPTEFQAPEEKTHCGSSPTQENSHSVSESDELANIYGPIPVSAGKMNATQLELEQRALELKLAAIEGTSGNAIDQAEREEWMLELPAVGLKGGLAALSNMKRTFHHGKERPDFSDRSIWTKTPQSAAKPPKATTSKDAAEELKNKAQAIYEHQRDAEQESIARKHKKKHKRDESLVEMHQKKLRKEQKKKEKELAASGVKVERRPFSRDVDLKLNKIDSNQTKQIVNKAKILNTKFASGHTKYL